MLTKISAGNGRETEWVLRMFERKLVSEPALGQTHEGSGLVDGYWIHGDGIYLTIPVLRLHNEKSRLSGCLT